MKIHNIRIQNVRGISDYTIAEEIYKNKPHILVAPNGFGKSSIAKAFKSAAEQTMIKFKTESDRHYPDKPKPAALSLDYDNGHSARSLSVTEKAHSNEIRKEFDILVISDLTEITASSKNLGKFNTKAKGKQVIPPIQICPIINKPDNPYKITVAKQGFEDRAQLLQNLNNSLFTLESFKQRATELGDLLDRLVMARLWNRLESIRDQINSSSGNEAELRRAIDDEISTLKNENEDFAAAIDLINKTAGCGAHDSFLCLWQVTYIAKNGSADLKKYFQWLHYDALKASIREGAQALSKAWKKPTITETKGKLLLNLPEPGHLSNGQRDVLVLFALFQKARYSLLKQRAIIVIDEVFDYLDDANLTVAQYYVTQLIEDYKNAGKEIYPLILTHLNPSFFKNYAFSKQKVIHLAPTTAQASVEAMRKLIAARRDTAICERLKDKISKYLVHFHDQEIDFSGDLRSINGCRSSWGKPGKFQEFLDEEFKKFAQGSDSDPLAICAITRRSIEKQAYEQIANRPDSADFFEEHGTTPKLNWARQRGAKIPEFHYLLRIIFDDGLHWDQRKSLTPIVAKLTNPVIRDLVLQSVQHAQLIPPHSAPTSNGN
jgi:hypothetical protein